ncbi:MAG: Hpt domain-containing protein, partial [Planctomycetaceae bacterium]
MPVDINEKVLAAFRVEHREHLEGIRTVLTSLESGRAADAPDSINEAFRLAHSLKGGASVCDLRPAEALAHQLENVFEQVRSGALTLDKDVINTVNGVLDAIEDWMAAMDNETRPATPRQTVGPVDAVLGTRPQNEVALRNTSDDARRLIEAFRIECPQHLATLRRFVAAWSREDPVISANEFDEAIRLAHTLSNSAQAADIESISSIGKLLEDMIVGFRMQETPPDSAGLARMTRLLQVVEAYWEGLADSSTPGTADATGTTGIETSPGTPSVIEEIETEFPMENAPHSANSRLEDTVRISTESLDKLLRSSRQLITESVGQDEVGRELEDICSHINEMQRERDAIRSNTVINLHSLKSLPEFNRLANYFESVDRGVQALARRTRQLCAVQKRNLWLLKSRGREIQQDVLQARMIPAEIVFQGARKLIRDLARDQEKLVDFHVTGFEVRADRMVLQALKDPVFHILRNCIMHGIEPAEERARAGKETMSRIDLRIQTTGNRLTIEVNDDGRGIDVDEIASRAVENGLISKVDVAERSAEDIHNFIFLPGFSTSRHVTENAGRGMGLSVVHNAVRRLQGEVRVSRNAAGGTKFSMCVPISVSTHRLLLVSVGDHKYALPVQGIRRLLRVKVSELETIEGKPVVYFQERPVPLISLKTALGLENGRANRPNETLHVAILESQSRLLGIMVDAFLAEKDLLVQELEGPAINDLFQGAVVLDDGRVSLVFDPAELSKRARGASQRLALTSADSRFDQPVPRVLVVDDSFTTRTLEKSLLEANGYRVDTAIDGLEAMTRLAADHYDLVISD